MNKYWFRKRRGIKSKDAGWGWVPVSWEGWITLLALSVLIVIVGFALVVFSDEATIANVILFLVVSGVLVLFAAAVSWKKTRPDS